jgi:hypothetical protein
VLEPKLELGIYGVLVFGVVLGISAVWMLAEIVLV